MNEPDSSIAAKELNLHLADEQINKVLRDKFTKELTDIKDNLKSYSSPFSRRLMWIQGSAFLILLCSISFIGYQQWQQSQQINQLVKQLVPIPKISPSHQ
jgi:stress-induced morphogen